MRRGLAWLAMLAIVAAPGLATAAASKARAIAKLIGTDGQSAGSVTFTATSHGVLMVFDLKGLAPGRACHPHPYLGQLRPQGRVHFGRSAFLAPSRRKMHGYLAEHGDRMRAICRTSSRPRDGTLHASVISNAFSLGNGKKSIFDRDGASIVVHAKADDYIEPAGRAIPAIALPAA